MRAQYANSQATGWQPHPSSVELVTPRAMRLMGETRWWVWFLALLVLLPSLGGFCLAAVSFIVGSLGNLILGPLVGLILAAITVLFFALPCLVLFAYGQSIHGFVCSGHAFSLISSVRMQRHLWMGVGLMSILVFLGMATLVVMIGMRMSSPVIEPNLEAAVIEAAALGAPAMQWLRGGAC